MKTFKQFATQLKGHENLKIRTNAILIRTMKQYAWQRLEDIAYDLQNSMGPEDSTYYASVGYLQDSLYDEFHKYDGYTDDLPSKIARAVVGSSELDDREDYNRREKNRKAREKRAEAAKNRPPRPPPKPRAKTAVPTQIVDVGRNGPRWKTMRMRPFERQ